MAQTKHLSFLVLVSALVAIFSFYQVETETATNSNSVKTRSLSSEAEPVVVSVEPLGEVKFEQIQDDANQAVYETENLTPNKFLKITDLAENSIENGKQLSNHSNYSNNCPRSVDAVELCRLPKSFIPAELYQKCCRGKLCLTANKLCSRGTQCCSGMCIDGFCAANSENKLFPDEVCNSNADCYSNICDFRPNSQSVKICYGDNTTNFCSRVTQSCTLNKHCCSNSCSKNRCIGSKLDPSPIGFPCAGDHSECLSKYCNLQTLRCE